MSLIQENILIGCFNHFKTYHRILISLGSIKADTFLINNRNYYQIQIYFN